MPGLDVALFLFQERQIDVGWFHSMQLVSTCIASVAKGDAKLNGPGALGFPILMEAHVLVGVRGATMFDVVPA
jgi:hypothetical protein